MGYSVFGRIHDADGDAVEGVKILPYFKKVDDGSDDSKWSTEYYETDGDGYYSYSPEDSNLLGSEGTYKKDKDKFYTAYVIGGGEKIDSLDLTHAMFHDHTIPKDDELEINLTWEPTRTPTIDDSSMPDATLTQHEYEMSEESYSDTSWKSADYGEDRAQKLAYDGENIFDGHQLIDTVYSWVEIDDREVANNSSDKYTFEKAGNYTIKIKVREKWNTFTEVTKDVTIKYNEPDVDFHWTPTETNDWDGSKIKGQEEITFHNDSSDLDDRTWDSDKWGDETYTYEWSIEDTNQDDSDNTEVVSDAAHADEPTHKFQSAHTYDIKLTCYWNDGFDDYEKSITKQIEIHPFTIVPDVDWDLVPTNRGQDVEFTPEGTGGDTDQISKYDWTVADHYPAPDNDNGLYTFADDEDSKYGEGSPDNTTEVDNEYTAEDTEKPVWKLHYAGLHDVKVVITYNDGWKDVTDEVTEQIEPAIQSLSLAIKLDKEDPISYEEEVTITNDTSDDDGLQYDVDWVIPDYYAMYNPNNDKYGEEEVDNTVTIDGADPADEQKHNFQSNDNHEVKLTVRYDNGFQLYEDVVTKELQPTEYVVSPAITTDIEPIDDGFVGKIEVKYSNDSTGDAVDDGRLIDEDWLWNDKDGDDDHVTERVDEDVNAEQAFTYQYASRAPYSAINGAAEQNINKEVKLDIRYNNGWEDNLRSVVTAMFEATPYEVSSDITYECNIEDYVHGADNGV